ncbi:MAG: methylenetetrahydrofolate reductase [Candidatus Delongbacteria bacterium]|nr:methylenetetrahydrofolate reductase [Candidatus Cloacimonadota bacterium]MCB9474011.1 methylenetetrahydrofolate reductase [Candidatus Delongbacteria bacterium]
MIGQTIAEFLDSTRKPFFSFEIIPPSRGGSISDIQRMLDPLMPHDPAFVDVTNHAADSIFKQLPDGSYRRHVYRKRPGTLGLCAAIKYRYNVETVPHILCYGFSREETEDALIELSYLDIRNLLAVRGDPVQGPSDRRGTPNGYAIDVVRQVTDMNRGVYLHEMSNVAPTGFCVGVAGYPEKHFESPSRNWDLRHLKDKVDAGASYVVSQMFYRNSSWFEWVRQCREQGITVPLIPGLKVLTTRSQLTSLPRTFHCDMPDELVDDVAAATGREQIREIGVRFAIRQARELLDGGAPGVHFFVTRDAEAVSRVLSALDL